MVVSAMSKLEMRGTLSENSALNKITCFRPISGILMLVSLKKFSKTFKEMAFQTTIDHACQRIRWKSEHSTFTEKSL